ncbi:hypothetical protein KKC44_04975 [Patescibacteria group bacterium]|nr:hypothetical protein [Patescibacteria group bacterium]MBU2259927.1 hypothetical protein [Patescibacteria group bacterium]
MSFDQPHKSPDQGDELARLLERNTEMLIEIVREMYRKGQQQVLGALRRLEQSPLDHFRANTFINVFGSNSIMAVEHYQHVTKPLFAVRDGLLSQQPISFHPSDPYKGMPSKLFERDTHYLGEAMAHVQEGHIITGTIDCVPEILSLMGTETGTNVRYLIFRTLESDQRTIPVHEFAERNKETIPEMLIEIARHLLSGVTTEKTWHSVMLKRKEKR